MMRKDVKLSFAIGGVLLAVVVVYLLVSSGGNAPKNGRGAELVTQSELRGASGSPAKKDGAPGGRDTATPDSRVVSGLPGQNRDGASDQSGVAHGANQGSASTGTAGAVDPSAAVAAEGGARSNDPNEDIWGKALTTGRLMMTQTPTPAATSPGPDSAAGATGALSNTGELTAQTGVGTANGATPATPVASSGISGNRIGADGRIDTSSGATPDTGSAFANGAAQIPSPSASAPGDTANPVTGLRSEASQGTAGVRRFAARTHVIARGETLTSIAMMAYGSPKYIEQIKAANPNLVPERMRPGITINLPAIDETDADQAVRGSSSAASGATTSAGTSPTNTARGGRTLEPVDSKTQYRVVANDSLYKIAMKLYGRAEMTDKLYELNRETIGPDRGKLKLHMVLKLPEPPSQAAASAH